MTLRTPYTQYQLMHIPQKAHSRKELVLLDENNPRSLVRLVPEAMAKRIRDLWSGDNKGLLGLTEHCLRKALVRAGKRPTAADNRIRLQFWLEYDNVQGDYRDKTPLMVMPRVLGFAMTKESFYSHYITDDHRLAWVICPPTDYVDTVQDVLMETTEKLREVVSELDVIEADGSINTKAVELLADIEKTLFNRVYGSKLPRKLGNAATLEVPPAEPEKKVEPVAIDPEVERAERKKRIAEMKAQLAETTPVIKDETPT